MASLYNALTGSNLLCLLDVVVHAADLRQVLLRQVPEHCGQER